MVAKLNGTDLSAPVVMFGAHMDQLGLVVRYISEDGYIYPERLGGRAGEMLAVHECACEKYGRQIF